MIGRVETKRGWVAFAIATMVASAPAAVLANESAAVKSAEVEAAERYAAEAYDAYARHDYTAAANLYLQALTTAPSAGIVYNLARIYDTKIRDRELAAKFYRRYIAEPGADADRVRIANQRLMVLRELETAARPLPARSAARKPPEPTRERGISGLQSAGIVSGVIGLAGVGIGVAFGLNAKSEADLAKELCDGNNCVSQRGVDAAQDAASAATSATASFIAGGTLTLLGAALLVFGRDKEAPEQAASSSLRVVPYAGPNAVGTQLVRRW